MSVARIPTLLVDTREKDPWEFKGRRVRIRRAALNVGDYSMLGVSGLVAVERKSVEDLFHTMTKGLARFERELERSRRNGVRFLAVIVEGDWRRLSLGSRFSWADPGRVLATFRSVCVRNGAAPYLADGRAAAESLAWDLLYGFWDGSKYGRGDGWRV